MVYDIIGLVGVFMILFVYGAVQIDKMDVKSMGYSVVNAVGAMFILISLYVTFNLSAFVIEVAWLVMSIFGIYQAFRRKSAQ